ncbi:YidC/Oxa1 family membrane protein insertase [Eubacterium ruminantium]|nr:YidC/Oxa1 family membrane protein insertase [Eubacterium ruminantium]
MLLIKKTGILAPLYSFMGWIMNSIYNILDSMNVVSLGFSIIIFTIVVRLLIFPLNLKSMKSSKIQKFIQPEFNKINKKYKGRKDQQSMMKQQAEVRELQSKYGIKMTSGCLTSLIQIPIFFSLYWVIRNIPSYVTKIHKLYEPIADSVKTAFESVTVDGGKYEGFKAFVSQQKIMLESGSLSLKTYNSGEGIIDAVSKFTGKNWEALGTKLSELGVTNFNVDEHLAKVNKANEFFGINLTESPGLKLSIALIIPLAAFLFQFLQTIAMQKQQVITDASQEATMQTMNKMTKILPVFSLILCISVSAGVGLYWAVGAFVAFITTVLTNAYYDRVDMEKIVEKSMAKAAIKNEKRKASGKKSLMERLAENAAAQQEARENQEGMEKYGSARLKNYTSNSTNNSTQSNTNVRYRQGSIASKANAMKQYNDKESK